MNKLFLIGLLINLLVVTPSSAGSVGDAAPSCSNLTTLDGTENYDLTKFQGKVVYVDFWASWCPPCIRSFPFMNQLQHDLKDQGLHVVAINLDEKLVDAEEFITKYPVEISIASDPESQCAKDFGVMAMPSSYLVDRKGVIRYIHLGFRLGEVGELRTIIEHVLNEPL